MLNNILQPYVNMLKVKHISTAHILLFDHNISAGRNGFTQQNFAWLRY